MKEKEFIIEMDISDEIGNDFRAQVTMHLDELRAVLLTRGYIIRKK